jgi:excisionase family DNA binding protein
MKQYYTPSELAKLLGVARQTIYNWIYKKKIVSKSLGRHYPVFIDINSIPDYLKTPKLEKTDK